MLELSIVRFQPLFFASFADDIVVQVAHLAMVGTVLSQARFVTNSSSHFERGGRGQIQNSAALPDICDSVVVHLVASIHKAG